MKNIALLFCAYLIAFACYAQNVRLSGTVVDNGHRPLAGVMVKTVRDSLEKIQATTNAKGQFEVFLQAKDTIHSCAITLTYLGYAGQTFSFQDLISDIDLGEIVMDEAVKQMGEATVTASRTTYGADKIVKLPSAREKSHSANCITLLNQMQIADLKVNIIDGTVSANGKDIPIYIDYVKATSSEMAGLHPDEIVRVEYNVHPQGEMESVGPFINVITRQRTHGGQLMLQANQQEELAGEYDLVYKVFSKKNQFSFAYKGGYENYKTYNDYKLQLNNPLDNTAAMHLDYLSTDMHKRGIKNAFSIGHIYRTESLLSNLTLTFSKPKTPQTDNEMLRVKNGGEAMTQLLSGSNSTSTSPSLAWAFRKTMKAKQIINLSVNAQYSKNKYSNWNENVDVLTQTPLFDYRTNADEDYYQLKTAAYYYKAFGTKHSITASFWSNHEWNDIYYTGDNATHTWMHTGHNDWRMNYNWKATSQLNLSASLGITQCIATVRHAASLNFAYFTPTFDMGYQFTKANIHFRMQSGQGYGGLEMRSNAEQQLDEYQVKVGNPDVNVVRFWFFDLDGNIRLSKGALIWQCGYDPIFHCWMNDTYYNTERNLYVHTYNTDATFHQMYAALFYNVEFCEYLRMVVGGRWYYAKSVAYKSSRNLSLNTNAPSAYISLSSSVGDFDFNVKAATPNVYLGQGRCHDRANVEASVSFTQPRYSISLVCRNIAASSREYVDMKAGPYLHAKSFYQSALDKRRCLVEAQVTFNLQHGNKKHEYDDFEVNDAVNSGIMKK